MHTSQISGYGTVLMYIRLKSFVVLKIKFQIQLFYTQEFSRNKFELKSSPQD